MQKTAGVMTLACTAMMSILSGRAGEASRGGDEKEPLLAVALLNVAVTTSSILRGMFVTNERPFLVLYGKALKVTATFAVTSCNLVPGCFSRCLIDITFRCSCTCLLQNGRYRSEIGHPQGPYPVEVRVCMDAPPLMHVKLTTCHLHIQCHKDQVQGGEGNDRRTRNCGFHA
jgi:hypothetical protein